MVLREGLEHIVRLGRIVLGLVLGITFEKVPSTAVIAKL